MFQVEDGVALYRMLYDNQRILLWHRYPFPASNSSNHWWKVVDSSAETME